mgnify:CR=1 FL=1
MYIHEHKEWPSFSWNKELVGEKLNKINKTVGYLIGCFSVVGFNYRMSAMVEIISRDIIASSEIEGVELDKEQVYSSVARLLDVKLQNFVESSSYIDGVVEMALDATVHCDTPLTKERLFSWYNSLFPAGSGSIKTDVQYRRGKSSRFGRDKVDYVTIAPEKIEEEMNLFLDWFNSDAQNGYIKSAIAHLWFVCIHPFDDGNGRIGRVIADMALSQVENPKLRLFSISDQIKKDKKQYYDILEKTKKGDCDITEWIIWYLDCLLCSVEQSKEYLLKDVKNQRNKKQQIKAQSTLINKNPTAKHQVETIKQKSKSNNSKDLEEKEESNNELSYVILIIMAVIVIILLCTIGVFGIVCFIGIVGMAYKMIFK